MATLLTGLVINVQLRVEATAKKAIDQSTPRDGLTYSYIKDFTFGADEGKVDMIWHDTRQLGSNGGGSEEIDLANAANTLKDAFGDPMNFVNIKLLVIENTSSDSTCILAVGAATGTQFDTWLGGATDTIKIHPGEAKLLICRHTQADGYVCTGGADDLLKISNESGAVDASYKIIIAGESA